jgi:hypothetical protein
LLREHLESLGFSVREEPFEFSPRTLWAFPLFGAGLSALALLEIPLLTIPAYPSWAALAAWISGLGLVRAISVRLAAGAGGHGRSDANLIATRGTAPVTTWIVAHVDSKAQGHSMAGRLIAVWVILAVIAGILVLAGWRWTGNHPVPAVQSELAAAAAVVAGALAVRGRLRGTSPGARDNGTGILAALAAAEVLNTNEVGVILTGAEEFGLLGARHLARTASELFQGTEVINLDTLADRGATYVVTHRASDLPLVSKVTRALASLGRPAIPRRLPLGILVDSVALGRVAASAVTVSRLDWSVLRLMHTPRDTPEGLDPAFAEAVGRAIGQALGRA